MGPIVRAHELADVDTLVDDGLDVVIAFDGLGVGGGGECFLATLNTVGSSDPDRLVGLDSLSKDFFLSDFTVVEVDLAGVSSGRGALVGVFRCDFVEREDACLACFIGFAGLLGASVPTAGPEGPFFGVLVPCVVAAGRVSSKLIASPN